MSKCSEINIVTENITKNISVVSLTKNIGIENLTKNIVVCTVKTPDAGGSGIGFMIIESTFIVG